MNINAVIYFWIFVISGVLYSYPFANITANYSDFYGKFLKLGCFYPQYFIFGDYVIFISVY